MAEHKEHAIMLKVRVFSGEYEFHTSYYGYVGQAEHLLLIVGEKEILFSLYVVTDVPNFNDQSVDIVRGTERVISLRHVTFEPGDGNWIIGRVNSVGGQYTNDDKKFIDSPFCVSERRN